jgi:putative phosphoserine phosphatase/1-acylglycerol-3-phosphate O-acyltransferase
MWYLRSAAAFLVPGLTGIVILLSGFLWNRDRARNLATRLIGSWGCRLAGIRVSIRDPDRNAELRPAVFVFNHQSGVDPVLLCRLLRRDVVGVARSSLRHHPVLGPLMMLADTVFVERSAGRGAMALEPARRALARGLAVAIAPEGHRQNRRGRFRPGALELARVSGIPLVPVVIHGSGAILPRGALRMRPGTVNIEVLAPRDAVNTSLDDLEALYDAHLGPADPADR